MGLVAAATTTTSADAVSLVLAYLLALLPFVRLAPEQVALLARQVSLALVGAIILGSIRRILLGVARVRGFSAVLLRWRMGDGGLTRLRLRLWASRC